MTGNPATMKKRLKMKAKEKGEKKKMKKVKEEPGIGVEDAAMPPAANLFLDEQEIKEEIKEE